MRRSEPRGSNTFDAYAMIMMKVDDVRRELFNKLSKKLHRAPIACRKVGELIELWEKQVLIGLSMKWNDRCARLAKSILMTAFERADKHRLLPLIHACLKQFKCDLLRATGRYCRMKIANV